MESKIKSKAEIMAQEKIQSLVFKFSAVTFTALFFDALYNIIDTVFVSRGVGDNAMGGVSIVFPFMLIQSAIAQTVGGGAASIVSRKLGEKDYKGAGNATVNAMFGFYLSAVIVMLIGFIFMTPILNLLGATPEIMPYAKKYFTIILLGNLFSTGFSSIIRAEGKMTYGILIWLIPTAVNIILDAVLIFGFHMGVSGAALATIICQFTSFLMSVIFFSKISRQDFHGAKVSVKEIHEILTLGLPTLIQMASMSAITVFVNNILKSAAGTDGVNIFAYLSKIISFAIVPFTAVSQAIAPIIGYNFGASKPERVKKAVSFSLGICLCYSVIAVIFAMIFPESLVRIFTDSGEILSLGKTALKIISPAMIFVPFSLVLGTYCQAVGKKVPAFFMNASIFIFMIPLSLILNSKNGLNGIWYSFLFAVFASAIFSVVIFLIERHKTRQRQN